MDLDLVEDLLVAPIVHRLVMTGAPVPETMTLEMLELVLDGVASRTGGLRPDGGTQATGGSSATGAAWATSGHDTSELHESNR